MKTTDTINAEIVAIIGALTRECRLGLPVLLASGAEIQSGLGKVLHESFARVDFLGATYIHPDPELLRRAKESLREFHDAKHGSHGASLPELQALWNTKATACIKLVESLLKDPQFAQSK